MDVRLPQLRARVDAHLDSLIEKFYEDVPFAKHLMSDQEINMEYYKRHTIEIILRLRMKRTIDALTIHYFTRHDPDLAKRWANYTDNEMIHDRLFSKDLEKVGVSTDEIYGTEPFFATKLLQGYFYYGLEHEGRPLASLCSSYFIEYTALKTQPKWLDRLEKDLGPDAIKGQRAHVGIDTEEDHPLFVWNFLSDFVGEDGEEEIIKHLDNIYMLFVAYFHELYAVIIEKRNINPLTRMVAA